MDDSQSVGGIHYDLDIDDSKLDSSLDQSDQKVKKFGDNTEATRKRISNDLSNVAKGLAVAGAGLSLISKNATDFTVNLVKDSTALSREIGVSVSDASRLTAAFARMGLASDQTAQMFGIFAKQITASTESSKTNQIAQQKLQLQIADTKRSIADTTAEIKKHGDKSGELNIQLKTLNNTLASQKDQLSKNADSFAKLGISTVDAKGKQKDFNTLLFEVADKFKALPNGIDKTSIALGLFGRSGKDMIKVLNLGSDGIQDLEKKADALGITLTSKNIVAVNNYIQSQKDLKEQTDALKIAIGSATTPVLTSFNREINNLIAGLIGTDGPLKTVTVDFIAFGGPVLAGAAAMLQLTANMVQAWPAITAVGSAIVSLTALSIAAWATLIVADLFLIVKAAQAVSQAFAAVDNASISATNYDPQADVGTLIKLSKTGTAAQKARAKQTLHTMYVKGFAGGTNNAPGGLAMINEKGPEIVDLPNGTRVIPNDLSEKMAKNSSNSPITFNIGTVNDRSDADYIVRRIDRNYRRINMGVSGSTP